MRTKAEDRSDACDGAAALRCGDKATDDGGLCEWHRRTHQRAEAGVEMLKEAQRLLQRIERGDVSAAGGRYVRASDRCWNAVECAAGLMPGTGDRAVWKRGRLASTLLRTAEMKRLVRSQPRATGDPPRWLAPGPSHKLAGLAMAVAMAVREMPERPLHPQQVVDVIRAQRVVRDPATGWCDTAVFDRMVAEINDTVVVAG